MAYYRQPNYLSKFTGVKQLNSIDLIKIWTCYDKDGSGYLEKKELDDFIKDLMANRSSMRVTDEMLVDFRTSILQQIDANKDGKVELGEFASMMPMEENFLRKFSQRKSLSRRNFEEIFQHYDPDGNGYINGSELLALIHDIMTKVEQNVTIKDIHDYREVVLKIIDKNTDGKLSKKELALLLSIERP